MIEGDTLLTQEPLICSVCSYVGCSRPPQHDVVLRGEPTGYRYCCEHMDAIMVFVGKGQPDFVIGLAWFRAVHRARCGYEAA